VSTRPDRPLEALLAAAVGDSSLVDGSLRRRAEYSSDASLMKKAKIIIRR
jgi:hypothetical protein